MLERPYVLLSVAASVDGYIDDTASTRLLLSNDADFDRVDESALAPTPSWSARIPSAVTTPGCSSAQRSDAPTAPPAGCRKIPSR